MRSIHRFGIAAAFVALAAVVSLLAAPDLPETMVTHWNAAGEPDGTMARGPALALAPVLSAVLLVVFAVVPRIDPLRENVASFRTYYDWFVVLVTGFLAALHVAIVAFNLGYEFDFVVVTLVGVAGLFYYVGVLLEHAERNWFVGIRTPWTLSSEAVWDRTHALGARLFKASALLALVGVLFGDAAVYFLLVPATATALITVAYSYYLYERLERPGDGAVGPER